MRKYILAIDQGTTSTRCIIIDKAGSVISSDQREHKQIYPQPGWVEHDPLEIWDRTQEVINQSMQVGGISPDEINAIGITNQRETTLVWDRYTGKPVCNALVWQDTRTDNICNSLAHNWGQDRFRSKVGLPLSTYFSAPKIKWILDNIEGVRERVEDGDLLFGTIDTWLAWNLSGGIDGGLHLTDVTNASRTMLMNLETLEWDQEILDILEIPVSLLPEIRSSSGFFGESKQILNSIPITGILGDQQAALFGQTCFDQGETKNTYGTGCFMLMNTGETPIQSRNGLLSTVGFKIGSHPAVYALEGSVAIAGALVQWLRDNIGLIKSSSEIESLAKTVVDNGGVYLVPAFSGLFAPHWRSDARGVMVGLTRYVNKGHVARAVLEATAYQTREILDAMRQDSGIELPSLKVDGGMVTNNLLMQFQADILNVPVVRPRIIETTALGAAYSAGLAVGFWSDLDELRSNWEEDQTWYPEMDNATRTQLNRNWMKAVSKSLDWID